MILQRLFELARRENLLEDPAFVPTPVACAVQIGERGEYLGLADLRRREETPARKRGAPPRVRLVSERILPVPVRPVVWDRGRNAWKTTDPAASGEEKPAVFLADVLPRVLPLERLIEDKDRAKFRSQRSTFWRFLRHAASETRDPALTALLNFAERLEASAELQERLAREVEQPRLTLADLCTFAWDPDRGRAVLERPAVQQWWRRFYETDFATQQGRHPRGLCQVTQEEAAIPPTVQSKINGLIPVGCRADAYLLTGIQSAESYGLEGAACGMVSARGVDGFTRALNALIGQELPGRPSAYRVGSVIFLFWTREPAGDGLATLFEPNAAEVERLLQSPLSGRPYEGLDDGNAFYVLSLSGNSGRVVVRDYLEGPLPQVQDKLAGWFRDLRVADASPDAAGKPASAFPFWQLVSATAADMERVAPEVAPRLLRVALWGDRVPDSVLAACIARLRAEGRGGFRPARMALIKLTLLRRNIPMTETLAEDEAHPAYVCGRLLAVFEQIQYAALGDVNATVTDKFFGTFSAAPAVVLGRLFANAQNHLRKLRAEKPGAFVTLDRHLAEVSTRLPAPPRGQLSLEDQGRFALGYYHERARRFQEIAERKAAKAEGRL
jgi:CRISPR-associated protein Csd1